ncbi:MAG: sensor histidine kinase [Hyphomicrobium sp.]|nr:sensor histidine kinase [Hyphomicrobium sp.]PPD08016.1 MAG: histidine kinase [Hyphomicrobium sp.]
MSHSRPLREEGPDAVLQDLERQKAADGKAHALPPDTLVRRAAKTVSGAWRSIRGRIRFGLPARLLVITGVFVMIAQILIFLPALASFRVNWLNDRINTALVSALAADAVPGREVPPALRNELLRTALVRAIAVRRGGARRVILPPVQEISIDVTYDMRLPARVGLSDQFGLRLVNISDALDVMRSDGERTMRVIGLVGPRFDDVIEVVMPEEPLQRAMWRYGTEIFWLSLFVALATAALVYIVISQLLVKPIRRLSRNIVDYSANPEDPSRVVVPSGRSDEIGRAEEELAQMQRQLSQLLKQKTRLAQLGLAVSKINHDLRNMLANAQLISDRLADSSDPTVQRVAPKLIASLDRAINFCNETLRFGRTEESIQRREVFPLRPLIEDVAETLALGHDGAVTLALDVDPALQIDADREHLFRIFSNLGRNAVQAIESRDEGSGGGRIEIRGWREGETVIVVVSDNGPGIPARAREKLFQPFQGSTRRGGTGLGLPISAELAQAHGGSLKLIDTLSGAAFELRIPDRPPLAS